MTSSCSWNQYELPKDKDKELNEQELKPGHFLSLEKKYHMGDMERKLFLITSCVVRLHKINACLCASHIKLVLASTNTSMLGFGNIEHTNNYVNN